ncbi:MAG: hypothetical protein HY744_25860 [Deltaproteobacteria bacterium]|nr:hypothetical protein [Deltaproteobacteria bacterium]
MDTQTVHDLLEREIASLPEALAREALDFILFMKLRRAEEEYLWKQVEEAKEHRRQHPEEVRTVTPEEWEDLSAHPDSKP